MLEMFFMRQKTSPEKIFFLVEENDVWKDHHFPMKDWRIGILFVKYYVNVFLKDTMMPQSVPLSVAMLKNRQLPSGCVFNIFSCTIYADHTRKPPARITGILQLHHHCNAIFGVFHHQMYTIWGPSRNSHPF